MERETKRKTRRIQWVALGLILLLAPVLGCAAAKELAAMRQVEFHLNGVSGARVAGIPLSNVRSYSDLGPVDVARLAAAIALDDVPLEVTVHVEGRNPETSTVTAKLVAMDWTCLVDDRDVVSGRLHDPYSFPPGVARDVPLVVRFNLVEALRDRNRRDLIEVALAFAGQRSSTHDVALTLVPSVETSVGRIRYPGPITLHISSSETR
jgi:hypothetical protein